jgi:hypothetical protein
MSLLIIFQPGEDVSIDGDVFVVGAAPGAGTVMLRSGDEVFVLRPGEPMSLLPGVTVTFFGRMGSDGITLAFDAPRGCLIRRIRRQRTAAGEV